MLSRMSKIDGDNHYNDPILKLSVNTGNSYGGNLMNSYLKELREKYWSVLIGDSKFTSRYTTNIVKDLHSKLSSLRDYDFTEFNIATLRQELDAKLISGIEGAIIGLFDELSGKFAYHDDFGANIHYYNGWKTNKAYKVNSKVILPVNGFSAYSWERNKLNDFYIHERISDMVKVFNYLAGEVENVFELVDSSIDTANALGRFRDLNFHYFDMTFYKKGTCHITFKNQKLLEKFNIFGSQRKGWLPPSYGKKAYNEMNSQEQTVIDEFQGAENYADVMRESDYYIVDTGHLLLEAPGADTTITRPYEDVAWTKEH